MSKQLGWFLGFGILGCMIFLGVLTWIIVGTIREEGSETRRSVDEATSSLPTKPLEDSLDQAADKGGELVDKVIGGLSDAAGKAKDKEPADLIGDIFKIGQSVAKEVDGVAQQIFKMDTSKEIEFGREVHLQISREQTLKTESAQIARLKKLAKPYLDARKNKQIDYTFSIIDDPQVNAFAHVGGYIYVNQGLLDFVEADEELQFVLGHEIGHVDLGHCAEQLTYAARAADVAGEAGATLVSLGYRAIALGYSEDKEFEADAYGWKIVKSVRPSAIAFLNRLTKLEASDEATSAAGEFGVPGLDSLATELDNHFKTHPPTGQRIKRLEELR